MNMIEVLELVYTMADGNCLDQEVDPIEDGDELEADAFRQRQALIQFREGIDALKKHLTK